MPSLEDLKQRALPENPGIPTSVSGMALMSLRAAPDFGNRGFQIVPLDSSFLGLDARLAQKLLELIEFGRGDGLASGVVPMALAKEKGDEIFNLLNRVNLNAPTTDMASALFGKSTSQKQPRAVQFGLRVAF